MLSPTITWSGIHDGRPEGYAIDGLPVDDASQLPIARIQNIDVAAGSERDIANSREFIGSRPFPAELPQELSLPIEQEERPSAVVPDRHPVPVDFDEQWVQEGRIHGPAYGEGRRPLTFDLVSDGSLPRIAVGLATDAGARQHETRTGARA